MLSKIVLILAIFSSSTAFNSMAIHQAPKPAPTPPQIVVSKIKPTADWLTKSENTNTFSLLAVIFAALPVLMWIVLYAGLTYIPFIIPTLFALASLTLGIIGFTKAKKVGKTKGMPFWGLIAGVFVSLFALIGFWIIAFSFG